MTITAISNNNEKMTIELKHGDLIIKYDSKSGELYLIGVYPSGFVMRGQSNYFVLSTKDSVFRDSLFNDLFDDKDVDFTTDDKLRIYEYNMTYESPIHSGLTPILNEETYNV